MLEKVKLQDFQCHEDLSIAFSDKITTLVGDSDKGKSAVLRAIRWACSNRPTGSGFQRIGSERVRVRLKVDGQTVKRERGKSENLYALDGKEYRAFGTEVPQDVQSLFALSDVNFQGQKDGLFWLGLSPPELARQLNKLVDLDVIDRVTGELASSLRSLRMEKAVVEGRLEEAKKELAGLVFVPGMDKELVGLEDCEKTIGELDGRISSLDGIAKQAAEAHINKKKLVTRKNVGQAVLDLGDEAARLEERAKLLHDLIFQVKESRELAKKSVPKLDLEAELSAMTDAESGYNKLEKLVGEVKIAGIALKKSRVEWNKAKGILEEESGGLCPLCGRPL